MAKVDLATDIRGFFGQYLVAQRGVSANTVLGYRDAMKLFLQFAAHNHRKSISDLTLDDLKADTVRNFLNYLEKVRKNSVPTRNVRLAAIRSFFQYLSITDPRHIAQCRTVLAIPIKSKAHRVPEYLEQNEVQSIIAGIDCHSLSGQRDDALLRLLYNTGMRAQELVDLDVHHLRLSRPFSVLIHGKGRKERTCPMWKETVGAIRGYLERRSVSSGANIPLFVNAADQRLSRFGVRYIIAHRVDAASKACSTLLGRKVTPHTFRHTTAMHLLQSNVDLNMIRSWLGHSSIETTNAYVEFDLEMKRKTLESCAKLIPKSAKRTTSWQRDSDVLTWLSEL